MLLRITFALSLSSLILSASSLDIYSDKSFYTYQPKDSYIGFNTALKAKDSTRTLELIKKDTCKSSSSLCQEHNRLKALHVKLNKLNKEQAILENLVSQYRPQVAINADTAIKTATKIASRMATLQEKSQKIKKEIQYATALFSKHAPSKEALFYSQLPQSNVTLTINRGLNFQSEYLLDMDMQRIEHTLLLRNRSGINITADEVKLFAKSAGYINAPIQFYPRKIRISQPQAKRAKMRKELSMMAMNSVSAAPTADAIHASKTQTRSYRINNLTLPSDAKHKKIPVSTEKLQVTSVLTWNPYHSSNVYHTASFNPKQTIESHQWKVRRNQELIENAPIRKEGKKILINVAIDYDLEVKRENINEFSEDKSLFSSDRIKNEGFKLSLTNRSKVSKTVKITERIPLSTQEEIQVNLEKIDLPYDYNEKTGKLTMSVNIGAQSTKTIKIRYSIRYPKETEIFY